MHLSKLPSGHWRVAVKVDKRRRTASGRTRSEAERKGAELLLALRGRLSANATIGQLVANYTVARPNWSPTYRADVISVIEQIPEDFAVRPAIELETPDANLLYRRLADDDWRPHRIRRLHEVLAAAYAHACYEGLLRFNPFEHVRKPSAPKREMVIPTHDEVIALLVAPDSPVERLALRLAATLGGRRGELVALQWRDITTRTARTTALDGTVQEETVVELVIRRSLRYTKATQVTIGDTKTGEAGHRVLPLDPDTLAMLEAHRLTQLEDCSNDPDGQAVPTWILSDNAGQTPWRPDRFTHVFDDARVKAGVKGVRLHDLRHYVATTMLQDGEPVIDVANQLGHSDTSTTLKSYAHFLPGRGRESANRRAGRLNRG